MTSIVKFQSLSGVDDESPHCYLLQIDDFKFLLDCGWDENCSSRLIDNLRRHARQIDAILVSHPSVAHLGLLPYAVAQLGINCPIYMTIPTCKLGQMFMYDLCQSKTANEEFDLFTLDDIDSAFERVIPLKHNQTEALRGRDYGLSIMPVQAGHMLGGTAWKIVKDDEEEYVYAVDMNHKRELHLNGCEVEKIQKPTLLITDGLNAAYVQDRRADRNKKFVQRIMNTTNSGGNVLITTDTAGRVLELAMILEGLWSDDRAGLGNVNLVLVSNVSQSTRDVAKGMIEWMSDKVIQPFMQNRQNPFEFRHVRLCQTVSEVNRVSDPKVILATPTDMDSGFSRELFVYMANHPKNAIILTNRSSPHSLARKLIDNKGMTSITLEMKKRVHLQGAELDEYEKKLALQKREEENLKKADADSSDESEGEETTVGRKVNSQHDIMISHQTSNKEGGFFKKARKAFPMFPFNESRMRWDDYGELISIDDYRQHDNTEGDSLSLSTLANSQSVTLGPQSAADKVQAEEEEEEKIPTKCIKTRELVSIRCAVEFIDYEGRIDGDSQSQLISTIQPKELILVRTKTGQVEEYMKLLKSKIPTLKNIFSPRLNEIVDATKERHIYQLKLKDSLLSNLNFVKVGHREIEVAWVQGRIDYFGGRLQEDEEMDVELSPDDIPTLEPMAMDEEEHETIFINDTKLTELKQNLQRNDIQAEFIGGNLVCNGCIAIKRSQNGQVQIEGALSEDYFLIRTLVYQHYAIV